MRPAVCMLCGIPCTHEKDPPKGDWVTFLEYRTPDPFALTHPIGLEYFCGEHVAAAKARAHLTSKEALLELQKQYVCFAEYKYPPIKFSWWDRFLFWIFGMKIDKK